jgi:hypothetical protein
MTNFIAASAGVTILLTLSACDKATQPTSSRFQIDTVTTTQLLHQVDSTAAYTYGCFNPSLNADSLLASLSSPSEKASLAFRPLDDRCADICGPGFIVELWSANDAILQQGFQKGLGRAFCATRWIRYSLTN